jgi:hypothetical protein
MSQSPELIFVYNANSGSINAVKDSLHKWLQPKSYSCALCSLTHNFLGEATQWKKFKAGFSGTLSFYHKDQFLKAFASKWLPKYDFPLVLIKEQEELSIFMNSDQLNSFKDLNTLIKAINQQLN